MSDWGGIFSHTSPVDDRVGVSEYQTNTRMFKRGELQRRDGMLSTSIAKQAGAIYQIMSANGLGSNLLTFDLNGTVTGETGGGAGDPWPPPPDGPKRKKPIIAEQDPACAQGGFATIDHSVTSSSGISGTIGDSAFGVGDFTVSQGCCYRVDVDLTVQVSGSNNGFSLSGGILISGGDFLLLDRCGGAVTVWNGSNITNAPLTQHYVYTGYFCAQNSLANFGWPYSIYSVGFDHFKSLTGSVRVTNVICNNCC